MRWVPFALWGGITAYLLLLVLSEFVFGSGKQHPRSRDELRRDAKLLAIRAGLALVWPFAALSRAGRNLLFRYGAKL